MQLSIKGRNTQLKYAVYVNNWEISSSHAHNRFRSDILYPL
jgi:hypothetical protein